MTVEYHGDQTELKFSTLGGELTVIERYESGPPDAPSAARRVALRECRYSGLLPREIMLELVWWSERTGPPGLTTYNGVELSEYLENM